MIWKPHATRQGWTALALIAFMALPLPITASDYRDRKDSRTLTLIALTAAALQSQESDSSDDDKTLLDLSGLVWMGGDRFLAVSDAKSPDEDDLNRVSLLTLPTSLDGLGFKSVDVFYPGGKSSDFESAARIPGTDYVLLCESSDNNEGPQRIFLAKVSEDDVNVVEVTTWDTFTTPFNIESSAAFESDGWLFFWAERAQGDTKTNINWARMSFSPFSIGPTVDSVEFELPPTLIDNEGNPLYSRPIVAMDIDSAGNMYIGAAADAEEGAENADNGPWRSILFRVGTVDSKGLTLDSEITTIATLDGFKIESVAIRETGGNRTAFIGTDDENFGGELRQVILPD